MKTFPTSAVWCFGILFISVSLITTGSSEVVGPADPVVALAGDDIILPCSLKPSVSAEKMTVRWTRLNPKAANVHLYLDGRDSNVDQFPSYRRRTSMFHEELKNGNVSLKLTRVTLSDAGSYRCFLPTLTSQVKETTVQLFVGAVSQPVISIVGTKGWGVVLKCESGGWFPEPEMEWLDSSGTILPADGPQEKYRDSEDLHAVRQHVTVNQTDTNRFTCRVYQPKINHLKETEIHVLGDVFPILPYWWKVGLSIATAVVVVLTSSIGVYWWRKYTEGESFQSLSRKMVECFQNLTGQLDKVTRENGECFQKLTGQLDKVTRENGECFQNLTGQLDKVTRENDPNVEKKEKNEKTGQYTFEDGASCNGSLALPPPRTRRGEKDRRTNVQRGDVQFVNRNKDYLSQNVTMVIPIAFYLIRSERYSEFRAAGTSQEQMRLLYEALDSSDQKKSDFYRILHDLKPDLGINFVDDHRYQLIQSVTKVEPIIYELFYKELYCKTKINHMTSQDQMRLLYKTLEEAEDSRRVKSDFYRILLDLNPDLVIGLDELQEELNKVTRERGDDDDDDDDDDLTGQLEKLRIESEKVTREKDGLQGELNELNKNLTGQLEKVTREKDELKEELRRAKATIQSLSTSPGGQQETQTPSQKSERIEGMEMKPLPWGKSAPEEESLLAAGPQNDDLDEMERGGAREGRS